VLLRRLEADDGYDQSDLVLLEKYIHSTLYGEDWTHQKSARVLVFLANSYQGLQPKIPREGGSWDGCV